MADAERYQHYEVLRREDGSLWELGRGAMGITYRAFDTSLHCQVALKVINNSYLDSEVARQRFLREARAAASLRHQNVASVFHLGTDHESYFYAMEFIDGETVDAYVKRKGLLDPAEALGITLQVSRALAAADKENLVHRDLKPSNLMLVEADDEKVVKVIDFGLAKSTQRGGESSGTLTVGGGFVGTPHFASPEQLEEKDIDIRSDIYSLGTTLYYMLAGRPPYCGSVAQIMSQHLYKPLPLGPLDGFPPCIVQLIQRMMEKDPAKRPQRPVDLRREILFVSNGSKPVQLAAHRWARFQMQGSNWTRRRHSISRLLDLARRDLSCSRNGTELFLISGTCRMADAFSPTTAGGLVRYRCSCLVLSLFPTAKGTRPSSGRLIDCIVRPIRCCARSIPSKMLLSRVSLSRSTLLVLRC